MKEAGLKSISFGFRDYAVHLFPGCIVISALLFLFFDFTWITPPLAPLLALLFLIGGYVVGFCIDAINVVIITKKRIFKISGQDPLASYFSDVVYEGDPRNINDVAAQALTRRFGKPFVEQQKFGELLYFMMRDIEAANERSSAFFSRINALENMAKNMGTSFLFVAGVLFINSLADTSQAIYSLISCVLVLCMGLLLLRRRMSYRGWLAKSVVRSFVALNPDLAVAGKDDG